MNPHEGLPTGSHPTTHHCECGHRLYTIAGSRLVSCDNPDCDADPQYLIPHDLLP